MGRIYSIRRKREALMTLGPGRNGGSRAWGLNHENNPMQSRMAPVRSADPVKRPVHEWVVKEFAGLAEKQ